MPRTMMEFAVDLEKGGFMWNVEKIRSFLPHKCTALLNASQCTDRWVRWVVEVLKWGINSLFHFIEKVNVPYAFVCIALDINLEE